MTCIARKWNNGLGAPCLCEKKIGDFCMRHGKKESRVRLCRDPKCSNWGKIHKYKWEHHGVMSKPAPAFYRIQDGKLAEPVVVYRKIFIDDCVRLVKIDLKKKKVFSVYTGEEIIDKIDLKKISIMNN